MNIFRSNFAFSRKEKMLLLLELRWPARFPGGVLSTIAVIIIICAILKTRISKETYYKLAVAMLCGTGAKHFTIDVLFEDHILLDKYETDKHCETHGALMLFFLSWHYWASMLMAVETLCVVSQETTGKNNMKRRWIIYVLVLVFGTSLQMVALYFLAGYGRNEKFGCTIKTNFWLYYVFSLPKLVVAILALSAAYIRLRKVFSSKKAGLSRIAFKMGTLVVLCFLVQGLALSIRLLPDNKTLRKIAFSVGFFQGTYLSLFLYLTNSTIKNHIDTSFNKTLQFCLCFCRPKPILPQSNEVETEVYDKAGMLTKLESFESYYVPLESSSE